MEEVSVGHIEGWFPAAAERGEGVISDGSSVDVSLAACLIMSSVMNSVEERVVCRDPVLRGGSHATETFD